MSTPIGLIVVLGISYYLAWLIARNPLNEKYDGGIVRIRTYSNKCSRIFSITVLIAVLVLFVIYHTGYPFEFKVEVDPPAPPAVLIIFALLSLFWISFSYKQLEIDKKRQLIIYGQGIFFTYSRKKIPIPGVMKILLITSYDDEFLFTLYIETETDREYLFDSRNKEETEMVAGCLKEHLELPVEYLKEEARSLVDLSQKSKK